MGVVMYIHISMSPQGNVTYYCLDRANGGQCPAPTDAQIASFQSGMQACFRRAVDVGFTTLAVAPHLDDGLGLGECINPLLLCDKANAVTFLVPFWE